MVNSIKTLEFFKISKEIEISPKQIESRIDTVRGVQVMLDRDLSEMYAVSTKRLNEQVRRNIYRFPEDFMFQLSTAEWENLKAQISSLRSQNVMLENYNLKSHNVISSEELLRSQNATLENKRGKHSKYLPYVFTEQGVAGLSGVLKSEIASKVHVAIMRAFVSMRKFLIENASVF